VSREKSTTSLVITSLLVFFFSHAIKVAAPIGEDVDRLARRALVLGSAKVLEELLLKNGRGAGRGKALL